MKYVVSVRPADNSGGPLVVTDDPRVVCAVLDAVQDRFRPQEDRPPLRLHPDPEGKPCAS